MASRPRRGRGGTRGGRRRKKAPTAEQPEVGEETLAADGEAAAEPVEAAPAPAKRRRPKIHVPPEDESNGDSATAEPAPAVADDPEAAANGQPEAPKKKTRRGTRGGRKRKKPTAASEGTGETPERTVARPSRSQRTGAMSRCPSGSTTSTDASQAPRGRCYHPSARGRLPAFSTSSFPRP